MTSRSEVYVKEILGPCFELAKRRFYPAMMEVNLAHALMLHRQAIISAEDARLIAGALLVRLAQAPDRSYDPAHEDLFFLVESEIMSEIGEQAAGNMHVAFSRNDLDAAIFRMALRTDLLGLLERVQGVREALVRLAVQHIDTVMPAHTHNQQAQPTTLAHYLLAAEANLRRDTERLLGLFGRVNRSPMGAAALATTGFPIDRMLVAEWLGFDGLVENSYDAVCASDHMLEATSAIMVLGSNLSRFVHDLMLMASNEFGVLKLDDSLVQISSIMPQKRNPVALEHLRAVLSRLMGRCVAVLPLAHNVPLGDINDVGDDLQPMVEEVVAEANRSLSLMLEVLAKANFDIDLLAARASDGFSAVTEVADTLVRNIGLPFRKAHEVVSKFVGILRPAGRTLAHATLADLDTAARSVLGRPTGLTEAEFKAAIDPRIFVARRGVLGGPAPAEIHRATQAAQRDLAGARRTVADRRAAIDQARTRLLEAATAVFPAKASGTGIA